MQKRSDLVGLGFGSLGVDEIEHCYFTLPDGVKLALRIWCPANSINQPELTTFKEPSNVLQGDDAAGKQFPCVLEYLPYRKADYTAERDHRRHPWLASHGYVVIRADMRGTGDSDGVYFDEYLAQEQEDGAKLIGTYLIIQVDG